MIFAVVGPCAAGKSTFAAELSSLIDAPVLGPDQFRAGSMSRDVVWRALLDELDAIDGDCIVESVIAPPDYERRLRERGSFVVLVDAPRAVRSARLARRGWGPEVARRALIRRVPLSPDVIVDGSADPRREAMTVVTRMSSGVPEVADGSQGKQRADWY